MLELHRPVNSVSRSLVCRNELAAPFLSLFAYPHLLSNSTNEQADANLLEPGATHTDYKKANTLGIEYQTFFFSGCKNGEQSYVRRLSKQLNDMYKHNVKLIML